MASLPCPELACGGAAARLRDPAIPPSLPASLCSPAPLTRPRTGVLAASARTHSASARVRCEAASAPSSSAIADVDVSTFDATVRAAGSNLVVLDMYTQWCGPCKLIAPKLGALAEQYQDVVFLKLDCNEENKPLAKSLGIKVVPTFKLIRHSKVVSEVVGAKYDDLVAEIIKHHLGSSTTLRNESASAAPALGMVSQVDHTNFYFALGSAGQRLVVLDMFTQWCGPCKLIAPKIEALAAERRDVMFLKLNCNEENKPLAKGLGIKSVPTFKFFKNMEQVGEVRGAKYEEIMDKISELA